MKKLIVFDLFPGGNEYPAEEAGVVSIRARDPHETGRVIEAMIACVSSGKDGGRGA